jgi:hypothetical protein
MPHKRVKGANPNKADACESTVRIRWNEAEAVALRYCGVAVLRFCGVVGRGFPQLPESWSRRFSFGWRRRGASRLPFGGFGVPGLEFDFDVRAANPDVISGDVSRRSRADDNTIEVTPLGDRSVHDFAKAYPGLNSSAPRDQR